CFLSHIILIEPSPDNKGIPLCCITLIGPTSVLLGYCICRHVNHRALNHWSETLIKRRQPDKCPLSFSNMGDFVWIDSRFDNEFVVNGQQLENDPARSNHPALGMLVELDDNTAHGCSDLGSRDHILRG